MKLELNKARAQVRLGEALLRVHIRDIDEELDRALADLQAKTLEIARERIGELIISNRPGLIIDELEAAAAALREGR